MFESKSQNQSLIILSCGLEGDASQTRSQDQTLLQVSDQKVKKNPVHYPVTCSWVFLSSNHHLWLSSPVVETGFNQVLIWTDWTCGPVSGHSEVPFPGEPVSVYQSHLTQKYLSCVVQVTQFWSRGILMKAMAASSLQNSSRTMTPLRRVRCSSLRQNNR